MLLYDHCFLHFFRILIIALHSICMIRTYIPSIIIRDSSSQSAALHIFIAKPRAECRQNFRIFKIIILTLIGVIVLVLILTTPANIRRLTILRAVD